MKRNEAPKKQPVPFAVGGLREDLLPTTPAGDNTASYINGFPPITMVQKNAGGLPPKGQDFNQILYELSNLSRWSSSGAINSFDSDFSTGVAGYPKGAQLLGDDGATIYVSTIDDNTSNPNTGGGGWFNQTSAYLKVSNNLSEIAADGATAQSAARLSLGIPDSNFSGRLLATRYFSSSTTYTPSPGTKKIRVKVVGGGGGGGGATPTSSGYSAIGGGGGSGGYAFSDFLLTSISAEVPITIGVGGAQGGISGLTGGAGGTTTFGSYLTATGGQGGAGGAAVTYTSYVQSGGSGGTGSGGQINGDGSPGNPGIMVLTNGGVSGNGGASNISGGGGGQVGNNNGSSGTLGAGGGGGISQISSNLMYGGYGGSGFVVIEELS